MTLRLFTCGSQQQTGDRLIESVAMQLQDDGAWTAAFDRNLDGVYYDFIVDFADGASFRSGFSALGTQLAFQTQRERFCDTRLQSFGQRLECLDHD